MRIASQDNFFSKHINNIVEKKFSENEWAFQPIFFTNQDIIFKKIAAGEADCAFFALETLPTVLPKGIVVTALFERQPSRNALVINADKAVESTDVGNNIPLATNARVAVSNILEQEQLLALRPDLLIFIEKDPLSSFISGNYEAVLSHEEAIGAAALAEVVVVPFSPREFVTAAGQGFVAAVAAADDFNTRRALQAFHHKPSVFISNIERRIKQIFHDEHIAAYAWQDARNFTHVVAATLIQGKLKQAHLSQTTTINLAERIADMLKL